MRTPTKTTAIALTGAVALASGAYALGSQAGDGSATAQDANRAAPGAPARGAGADRRAHGPGPMVDGLAERLGVTPEALRTALMELRSERPSRQEMENRRNEHAAALARELNIDAAKVRAAFEKLKPERRMRMRRDRRPRGGPPPGAPRRGDGPRPGLRRRGGPDRAARTEHLTALARELDVSVADLRAAFVKLREAERARHEAERNEFTAKLAEKLNIPVEKVREALPAFGPHHHGRRGP